MRGKYNLTKSEQEIMELLWETDRSMSAKEILDHFNEHNAKDWKKQTLNTFLSKLVKNEFIERISEERRYLYSPVISRTEYRQKWTEQLIREIYNGSFLDFVCTLSGGEMISREEAEEIRKLLEDDKL